MRAALAGLRAFLPCSVAILLMLMLGAGETLAGSATPPKLRVKPEKLELRLSQTGEPLPPPPDSPLPVYIALAGRSPGPAVTLEVEADGAWEIWVQASGDAGPSFPAGALFMAPVGTPPPAAGTPQPPWPWLQLTSESQLLASGQGRAELFYQVRLRLSGDEAVASSARVDLTFTLVPPVAIGPAPSMGPPRPSG